MEWAITAFLAVWFLGNLTHDARLNRRSNELDAREEYLANQLRIMRDSLDEI